MTVSVNKEQARRFMLLRQGLLGPDRFVGDQGLLDYVRMAGCVQFDPVDICGRSHELAFLSRVRGFDRAMLDRLLYGQRALIDYFDKNMCILPAEDWPYLEPIRQMYRRGGRGKAQVDAVAPEVLRRVRQMGNASAQELDMKQRVDWYWSPTTLGRAALETLYFRGDLVIHHKKNTVKSYALAEDCLPKTLIKAECPLKDPADMRLWQAKRRIGAVGMLWNAPSDAWLGIEGFKAEKRAVAFEALLAEGSILPVSVDGLPMPFYIRKEERDLLESCAQPVRAAKRVRFLAPLDCLLWDRRLISALFGFDYKWEVYTPAAQRKYGHYTLPVLYGERFVGRVEPVCDRKAGALFIRRFWPEAGFRVTKAFQGEMEKAARTLCRFHGLDKVIGSPNGL